MFGFKLPQLYHINMRGLDLKTLKTVMFQTLNVSTNLSKFISKFEIKIYKNSLRELMKYIQKE